VSFPEPTFWLLSRQTLNLQAELSELLLPCPWLVEQEPAPWQTAALLLLRREKERQERQESLVS
jgi:hypothetical protein